MNTVDEDAEALPWRKYICRACGLIYDEEQGDPDSGLAPGTRFEAIPDDWECPLCGVTKLDFEPLVAREVNVAEQAVAPRQAEGIVIVGGGIAGWAAAEALRALDTQVPITLVSACAGDLYHKPELSVASSRGRSADALVREAGENAARRLGIRLLAHTQVVGLSPTLHQLRSTRGNLRYTQLVLALGARPSLPAVLPAHLCWRINHLDSWARLQAQLARGPQRIAMIGAGMIGCELAEDLAAAGHQVTLLDRHPLPLSSLLPEAAARALLAAQESAGIEHIGPVEVGAVSAGTENSRLVCLEDGRELVVDQVIAATGLVTDARLPRLAGLEFDRGIAVDPATLRSSDPDVYALGDCISLGGEACRFIEPIAHQASAVAASILGRDAPPYRHRQPVIRLKTRSFPIELHGTPCADVNAEWSFLSQQAGQLIMEQTLHGQKMAHLRAGKWQAVH